MKVVITGASGNIGARLLRNIAKSHLKDCVVGLTRGNHPELITTDYSIESLSKILESADVVVHLAARRPSHKTEGSFDENVLITENLLRAMKKDNVKRIVLNSSVAVYDGIENGPWGEELVCNSESIYASSKLRCEKLLKRYEREGIEYVALRCGIVYGPGTPKRNLLALINETMWKLNIESRNSYFTRRDFIYIEDVVDALEWAIYDCIAWNNIYNLGSVVCRQQSDGTMKMTRENKIVPIRGNMRFMNSAKIYEQGFKYRFPLRLAFKDIINIHKEG